MRGRIAGAAALIAALASLSGSPDVAYAGSTSAAPLQVVTSLQPAAVLYGDPVTADVEVDYDPRAVEPSSIRVLPSFIPYVATSAAVVQRLRPGVVRFRYSLVCVTDGCLPTSGPRLVRLERVTVTALAHARTVTVVASWPSLRISSRLAASDLSGRIRFRSPTTPPTPAYRLRPGPLAGGLIAAAALCALAAAALAGRELTRRSARSVADRLSRLELAIVYVRDSARRSDPDRRRALALLAEAVDDDGVPALAADAAETAWSKPAPTPAGATELADRAAGLRGVGG
jgi:hypothetical protein